MTDIVMPRLSDTMEEGTILRWLKRDGDEVARGDELVEIETDKATMVYESDAQGTLRTLAAEGDTLAVGEVIALVGDANGAARSHDREASRAGVQQPVAADGGDGPASDGPAGTGSRVAGDGVTGAPAGAGATGGGAPSVVAGEGAGTRVKASPLARRIARERGLELRGMTGSGPGGRIVRADVEEHGAPAPTAAAPVAPAAAAPAASAQPAPSGEAVSTAKGDTTTVELTRTQQTIARRMAESKATIPDFSLQVDVDMESCVRLRRELVRLARPDGIAGAQQGGEQPTHAPTYNDMVVKACALALREHPLANGSYRDGRVQLHSRVNVGVAVAAEGALVVPTVFDADSKALGEIARETRTLAERVRGGAITPPELGGGTFTVSNLGMFGVSSFTAIINPPQAAILTVGALRERAVVAGAAGERSGAGGEEAGEIVVRPMLTLTLVCDHRILYGADAARFAARVRELLEAPAALTL